MPYSRSRGVFLDWLCSLTLSLYGEPFKWLGGPCRIHSLLASLMLSGHFSGHLSIRVHRIPPRRDVGFSSHSTSDLAKPQKVGVIYLAFSWPLLISLSVLATRWIARSISAISNETPQSSRTDFVVSPTLILINRSGLSSK